jgi:hypothetical protein
MGSGVDWLDLTQGRLLAGSYVNDDETSSSITWDELRDYIRNKKDSALWSQLFC